jgi:hypothetical protein
MIRRLMTATLVAALAHAHAPAAAQAASLRTEVLDDFRDASAWHAAGSDQVRSTLRRDTDGSLCLDYDFRGVSGYAVMRRTLPVQWPAHFDLVVRLKGRGAVNDLQVKFVDATGDNVWWMNRPNATLPTVLTDVKIRRRHIDFAWGPVTDRTLRGTKDIEFVVAAGRDGGRGSLCVSSLTLVERAPDPATWPDPRETASAGALHVDWQLPREFNGLALRWPAAQRNELDYDVHASDDGRRWRLLRRVRGSDGGLDALHTPESEARHLRVRVLRGSGTPGVALRSPAVKVELRSPAQWQNFNAVLAELATDAPKGDVPRAFVGEQNYWTLVGVDGGGERSALMSEDGALEVGRAGFSVEPAVLLEDGEPATWARVALEHTLREGHLPLPAVHWRHAAFTLDVQAAADGPREAPQLLARYRLRNAGDRTRTFTLVLAVRPWQVNPPQQFLSTPGGASPVATLRRTAQGVSVNGRLLRPTTAPDRVTALPFDGGLSLAALQAAPGLEQLNDPQRHASAALQYRVTLAPNAEAVIGWTAPLGAAAGRGRSAAAATNAELDARMDQAAAQWRERLNRVRLRLPNDAQAVADTLRTSLAHMLLSRDGPALRPATRAYARTWVRDGAMMVAALLRLGEVDASREFVDWFAGHIFDSGKVPCCVDQRGADPIAENDSHGQYLYAVAELWRHTRDRAFLERHWPRVQRVVAYQESLRQSERGAANRDAQRAHLFGLMPPSISHEGYSDKPAYSYWDDFWALRGYKDAVVIARALGREEQAAAWSAWRDEFERELARSIEATAQRHSIGFIAGAADRGDFDATSTTMAMDPAQAAVPSTLLTATFERYWQETITRAEGQREWKDLTPYELRNVGALVRLGRPQRAHAVLNWFFGHRRPAAWNQWAEVVLPNARTVRFLGDMPHAWVSSDYIRSALDLFAYDRESDSTLVLGAGIDPRWRRESIEVQGLSTPYGRLDFRLAPAPGGWTLEVTSRLDGLRGGLRLAWPGDGPLPRATLAGRPVAWQGRELPIPSSPALVQLQAP